MKEFGKKCIGKHKDQKWFCLGDSSKQKLLYIAVSKGQSVSIIKRRYGLQQILMVWLPPHNVHYCVV